MTCYDEADGHPSSPHTLYRYPLSALWQTPLPGSMSTSITIRLLQAQDAALLDNVAPGVFDNDIDARSTAAFLADPRHHMVVALLEGQVVGMASAVQYFHPDKRPQLWINEVGVAPAHQRQGIGRQLMQALLAHGHALGCHEAWLGTELENTPARQLYTSVGGREEPMVYFTFRLGPASDPASSAASGEPSSTS